MADYLLWPLLTLCPRSQETKQSLVGHGVFLLPAYSLQLTPVKPILIPNYQLPMPRNLLYLEPQWPHLTGFQQYFLPGNTEPPQEQRTKEQSTHPTKTSPDVGT